MMLKVNCLTYFLPQPQMFSILLRTMIHVLLVWPLLPTLVQSRGCLVVCISILFHSANCFAIKSWLTFVQLVLVLFWRPESVIHCCTKLYQVHLSKTWIVAMSLKSCLLSYLLKTLKYTALVVRQVYKTPYLFILLLFDVLVCLYCLIATGPKQSTPAILKGGLYIFVYLQLFFTLVSFP